MRALSFLVLIFYLFLFGRAEEHPHLFLIMTFGALFAMGFLLKTREDRP